MPVGRWVIRTAESVVLTDCPPGPDERKTSIRRSPESMVTSTSSASGATSTPAAEVWIRPCDSVTGTRCTRCTPPSNFSRAHTPSADGAGRLDGNRGVLVAAEVGLVGRQHLGLPAATLGVPQVHPQQVAGEQRGFLAALPRLDLDHHVLAVVRVARGEQFTQFGLQFGDPLRDRGGLVGEARVLVGQLAGGLEIAPGLLELVGHV